jgi:hypothetical protein
MHEWRISAHFALGARTRTRDRAKAPGTHTAGLTTTSADCRTPLRNAQSVDGSDALLDQDAASCEYGNEPARIGLQLQTIGTDSRGEAGNPSSANITSFACRLPSLAETRIGPIQGHDAKGRTHPLTFRLFTQPRPKGASRERALSGRRRSASKRFHVLPACTSNPASSTGQLN